MADMVTLIGQARSGTTMAIEIIEKLGFRVHEIKEQPQINVILSHAVLEKEEEAFVNYKRVKKKHKEKFRDFMFSVYGEYDFAWKIPRFIFFWNN